MTQRAAACIPLYTLYYNCVYFQNPGTGGTLTFTRQANTATVDLAFNAGQCTLTRTTNSISYSQENGENVNSKKTSISIYDA